MFGLNTMHEKHFTFGLHAVESLLKNHPKRIVHISILQSRKDHKIEKLIDLAKRQKIKIEFATREKLDHMSDGENHQGVIALCHKSKALSEDDLEEIVKNTEKNPVFLILDQIQDPHNLGACLRSADAAGVTAVIAPRDKSVGLTPTVNKVASGAAETIPFIQVTNLARTLRFLKEAGIWIFGADAKGSQTIFTADLKIPLAFVLGAEGKGLRHLTREHCDFLLNIPMQGSVSSLNVSVAAGIFLFEMVRQRFS